MSSATASAAAQGNPVGVMIGVLLCIGGGCILAFRWARTAKARADGEPRGQVTPGAWVVIGVAVAFFIITAILNLIGAW
jgi:uncharacterized membrane protein YidH (DUF202 family)